MLRHSPISTIFYKVLANNSLRLNYWRLSSNFFGAGEVGTGVGIVVSTLLLILNAYTKDYDLGELAQKHKQAANEIWLIREKYLSLLTDLAMGENQSSNCSQSGIRYSSLHSVYSGSPSTTFEAYKKHRTH